MIEWALIDTKKINRIGYDSEVQSLYIDFKGSETDTAYIKVPESLFRSLIHARRPDDFFETFVSENYEVANIPVDFRLKIA